MARPSLEQARNVPHLLVVENDRLNLYLWQRYTAKAGWQMESATLEDELVSLIRRTQPALVVLDITAPIQKWKEILHELKILPDIKHIPCLVCSALEDELLELSKEADGYLRKPVLYDDFLDVLSKIK